MTNISPRSVVLPAVHSTKHVDKVFIVPNVNNSGKEWFNLYLKGKNLPIEKAKYNYMEFATEDDPFNYKHA